MKKGSIIFWLLVIVAGLAALKFFFNWDIFDAAASEQGISTIRYIRNVLNFIWSYVEMPVKFAWNEVLWPLIDLFWQTLQAFIDWGKNNANTPIEPIRY
ncbi:MAG: hypothetical protein AAB690_02490 [Patescibacteria group bacterium]